MPYQFVPDHVEAVAVDALEHLHGFELLNIYKDGSHSGYRATFSQGGVDTVVFMAYDFGLFAPENERGLLLAEQVRKDAGLVMAVAVEETRAAVEFEPLPEITVDIAHEEKESTPADKIEVDSEPDKATDKSPAKKSQRGKGDK